MKSIWQASEELAKFDTLSSDASADVLIIGGGMAGILTAYFLQQSNTDYMLVEKDRICSETTQNTTAKITYQHGLIYSRISDIYGAAFAKGYLKANRAAFEKYAELCGSISCDFETKDNYVYSINDRSKLEAEMKALEEIGCDAEFCEEVSLPIKTAGAVKFPNQAQFNPMKFIGAICPPLNIYENTFVREIRGNSAYTDRGKIKAKKIIVATHFPFINRFGLYPLKLYQHRSYVLALEGAENVNGMYVDESETGLSFRNYKSFLLVGGGGHRTGKGGGKWEELKRFSKEAYPDAAVKFRWAAQDCMSLDGIPYIGRYSLLTPDLTVASGFNKWGMTGSMVAAMLLSDSVLGKENELAEIFSPSRSIMHPQLFVNCAESALNLISPSKKRCTHLGCALKWNSAEHSWDCPCHGSRFSQDGKIINNPAQKKLRQSKTNPPF